MGIWRANKGIAIPSGAERQGAGGMTTEVYSDRIGQALRERYGDERFAAKKVARLTGGTDRAAKNWLAGICGPHVQALLLLMAREPAVAAAVEELVERQRQLDARRLAPRGGGGPSS